jgi:hypothetical protein
MSAESTASVTSPVPPPIKPTPTVIERTTAGGAAPSASSAAKPIGIAIRYRYDALLACIECLLVSMAAVVMAVARLASSLLYGLSPTDPLTFGGIAAVLMSVTLVAGPAAARKGLNVDPQVVLRHE